MISFISTVPIAHAIEVKIAHVISFNCTNYFAILLDLTPSEILFPKIVGAILSGSYQTVLFVGESDGASDLMQNWSHENTAQIIIGLIAADFASIREGNFFETLADYIR